MGSQPPRAFSDLMVSMHFWEEGRPGEVFMVLQRDRWDEMGNLGPWQSSCHHEAGPLTEGGSFAEPPGEQVLGTLNWISCGRSGVSRFCHLKSKMSSLYQSGVSEEV